MMIELDILKNIHTHTPFFRVDATVPMKWISTIKKTKKEKTFSHNHFY